MKTIKIFVAACILSSRLSAQDTTSTNHDVMISSTKTPLKQSQTGKVITIISQDVLQKSAGLTISELLNRQAGITINGAFQNLGSVQSIYTRGASSGRTLITIDGIPVTDASTIGNEFDINLLAINNIERIEICRGAQSTLYGSDAIAGVINIITKKGIANKLFNSNLGFTAGAYNTYRTDVGLYGGSAAEGATYRINYSNITSKGFSSAFDSAKNQRGFDNDSYKQSTLSMFFGKDVAKDFNVSVNGQFSRYKTSIDAGGFRDEKDYVTKNRNELFGTGAKYTYTKGVFVINYVYNEGQKNLVNDSIDKPGFATYSKDDFTSVTHIIEAYNSVKIGSLFTLLTGVDYRLAKADITNFSVSSFGPYKEALGRDSIRNNQASFYASLYATYKNFHVEFGGRYNKHSQYGNNTTFTFNPSFNINKQVRVFGSVATAFKAPTLYQLYSPFGDKNLKPETAINYELGGQYTLGGNSIRFVGFNRLVRKALDFDYVNFKYYNGNKQNVSGIELEATIALHKKFTLSANYTYLTAKESLQSRETFNDTTYAYLLRRPAHNVNITLGYQLLPQLYLSASAKYVSGRKDVGGYLAKDISMDAYTLLNAYAEYKLHKTSKFFIDLKNITNKIFYDINGYNSIPFMWNAGFIINL
jgi:vitamin B12 transporter